VAEQAIRIRGVRSWGTPYTKRVPLVDVLIVSPEVIETRSLVGRSDSHSRREVRRVARVSYRVLPLVRRTCFKVTFTTERVMPLFFRPWRVRRAERAFATTGWDVATGERI
jgi:hypothetical protein